MKNIKKYEVTTIKENGASETFIKFAYNDEEIKNKFPNWLCYSIKS
jgi:hypothetical protein